MENQDSQEDTEMVLEESQWNTISQTTLPSQRSNSASEAANRSSHAIGNATYDPSICECYTQLTQAISPLSLNMISTQDFQSKQQQIPAICSPRSNSIYGIASKIPNNAEKMLETQHTEDILSLNIISTQDFRSERQQMSVTVSSPRINGISSVTSKIPGDYDAEALETQLTEDIAPLSLDLLSTQDFRSPNERVPGTSSPPPAIAHSDQNSSPSLIGTSVNNTPVDSPKFQTQLTQDVAPLSLAFISTLEFGTGSSDSDRKGLMVPACLRDSVFSRPPPKTINEAEFLNESIFMNATQAPCPINKPSTSPGEYSTAKPIPSQKKKQNSSSPHKPPIPESPGYKGDDIIFFNKTQCPPVVKKDYGQERNETLNESILFFNETQCPTRHPPIVTVAESTGYKDDDIIFFNETQCPPRVVMKDSSHEDKAALNESIFFNETQCAPRPPRRATVPGSSSYKDDDTIFFNETQCPSPVVMKDSAQEHKESLNESIFLNETQCLVPEVIGNAQGNRDSLNESIFLNETQCPLPVVQRNSVRNKSLNENIFFNETQCPPSDAMASRGDNSVASNSIFLDDTHQPSPKKSPTFLHPGNAAITPRRVQKKKKTVKFNAAHLESPPVTQEVDENDIFLEATQLPGPSTRDSPRAEANDSIFLEATQLPGVLTKKSPENANSSIFFEDTQLPEVLTKKSSANANNSIFFEDTEMPNWLNRKRLISPTKSSTRFALEEEASSSVFWEETQLPEYMARKRPCSRTTDSSAPEPSSSDNIFLENTQIPAASSKINAESDGTDDDILNETQVYDYNAEVENLATSHGGGATKDPQKFEGEPPSSRNMNSTPAQLPANSQSGTSMPKDCKKPEEEDLSVYFNEPFDDFDALTQLPQAVNERTTAPSPSYRIESDSEVDDFILSSDIVDEDEEATQTYNYAGSHAESEDDGGTIVLAPSPDLLHTQNDDTQEEQPSVIFVPSGNEPRQLTQCVVVDSDSTDSDVEEAFEQRDNIPVAQVPGASNEVLNVGDSDSTDSDLQVEEESAPQHERSIRPVPSGEQAMIVSDATDSDGEPSLTRTLNASTESISLVGAGDEDCPEYHESTQYDPPERLQPRVLLSRLPSPSVPGPSRAPTTPSSEIESRPKRTRKPTMKSVEGQLQRSLKRRGRADSSRDSTPGLCSSGSEAPSPITVRATLSVTVTTKGQKKAIVQSSTSTPRQGRRASSSVATPFPSVGSNPRVNPLRLRRSGRISARESQGQESQELWRVSSQQNSPVSPALPSSSDEVIRRRRGRPRKAPAVSTDTDSDSDGVPPLRAVAPVAPPPRPVTRQMARKRSRRRRVGIIGSDDDTP